ncbi:hypothetical protein SPF06_18535 [Sinomonas sp. JGH33]|uniref:HPt domain-containing protein n=1 Tax=Sinomonas terricola TaxID=3110330 RepID=A0ABU5TB35_9MICC|nr:hypothetical protein [Sinomonas sp. JGH33]MEA5456725.1 hypothetical protein [Sinomonas sp. JGH33]
MTTIDEHIGSTEPLEALDTEEFRGFVSISPLAPAEEREALYLAKARENEGAAAALLNEADARLRAARAASAAQMAEGLAAVLAVCHGLHDGAKIRRAAAERCRAASRFHAACQVLSKARPGCP